MLSAKDTILKKIRQALNHPVPLPFPEAEVDAEIFAYSHNDLAVLFAEEFAKLQGKFLYCAEKDELKQQLQALILQMGWTKIFCSDPQFQDLLQSISISTTPNLKTAEAAITGCEFLVARTGSLMLSSAQTDGRTASVYAPVHICIAHSRQLVLNIEDALKAMKQKYAGKLPSFVTLASGPSRTADIEKTLVTGVHGPKEVFCFMLD